MLKLIGTDERRFYEWELNPGTYIVGRNSDCDFFISDSTISRQHAKIDVSDDGETVILIDMSSHNGTVHNGQRIVKPCPLKSDDRIQFGRTDFRIRSESDINSNISTMQPSTLADDDLEKSVVLSVEEALTPLPSRIIDLSEVLPTIFEMAKMLILPEPKEEMLNRYLKLIGRVIPNDRLAVLLSSGDKTKIHTAACCVSSGKDPGFFSLSQSIMDNVLTEKNSILIDDARKDPRFSGKDSIIMSELKSAMAVPLFDEDNVFGILYADTSRPDKQYNDDYLRLFATMGNIIASKLLNYNLMQERQDKEIYEAELSRASMIQKNLVNEDIPNIPGYSIHAFQEQCRSVGGDLYDLAVLPDGNLLFLLADVSGKGMGAALLMSNILASFRILYEDNDFDLIEAVNRVSLEMFRHSSPENFATLFIGLLNPETDKLNFVNAGHNPPLILRKDGKLEYLEASGIMIGAMDTSTWSEDETMLESGETLLIFTDGVTEAGIEDEEYSDERLEKLAVENRNMAPKELSDIIIADVDNHIGDAHRSDDITMLILKREQ